MLVGLFEKILSMSLFSCYVILVVLLMRLLLHKCERKYSFLLWFVVFLNLCLPVSIEGPFSLIPNVWMEWTKGLAEDNETVLQGSISTGEEQTKGSGQKQSPEQVEIHYVEMDWNAEPVDAAKKQQLYEELIADLEKDNLPESSMADADKETLAEETVTPLTGNRLRLPSKQEAVMFIWLAVIAIIGGISLFKGLALSRKLKKSREDKDVSAEGVVCAKDIDAPFLWGIWNPMIYLPESMEEEEKSYIIAHESYHRKRFDHITKPMVFVIVLVHWFNPLVWVAYALFVRDMEISCDEAVLSQAQVDIKKQYASSLLKYAAKQNGFVLSPLTFGEPSLKSRIQNVLDYKKKGMVLTLIAICMVGLTSCGLILRPESGQTAPPHIVTIPQATKKPGSIKEPENVPTPVPQATKEPVQEVLLPQYLHYPSYLYEILCYRETGVMSKNLQREEGAQYSYAEDYAAATASAPAYDAKRDIYLEEGALCLIEWLKLGDDLILEDLTFDFGDRFEEEGVSQGSILDIFYDKEWNKVFLLVNAFTMPEEEAEKQYKEVTWLLEFTPEDTNNYRVEKYDTNGAWFGECVRIGDSVFLHGGSGSVPFEIDLVTKEGRSCQQEYDVAKQAVEDFAKAYEAEHGVPVGIHWFSATARYENVTIFTGIVQEAMDMPTLATIYLARQNGEVVPAMLIDEETGEITINNKADMSIAMAQVPAELEENPEWMQRILEISNENGGNARDFGWENSVLPVFAEMTGDEEEVYEDNGEVDIESDYKLECWMQLQDGTLLENLSFDLRQEMEAHAWTKAFVNGVFYREDLGQVYIALPTIDIDMSSGILIINFPKDAPEAYEVHAYEGMSVWFGECVMVGDDICFHAANGSCPWRVNIKSWEIYHTAEEFARTKTIAEAYCKQLAVQSGKQLSLQWFYASGCIDDVEVYTGYIGDDVSTTEAIIYTGYKDGEWQGSMIVERQTSP